MRTTIQQNRRGGKSQIHVLAEELLKISQEDGGVNYRRGENIPSRVEIDELVQDLLAILYHGYFGRPAFTKAEVAAQLEGTLYSFAEKLRRVIEKSLRYHCRKTKECKTDLCRIKARQVSSKLLKRIPEIRRMLTGDIQAAYDGDPAAKNINEVISCYPCVLAISIHRVAHEIYRENIPLVPRMMSEYAHSATGIDIHPGSKIGRNFFIDHGTGVVIGETTTIGDNVKLYQGVTLGALSFPKDERGRIVRGRKRHPTIEDDVTIYAGATILGEKAVIGKGAVIGGNVWLTSSVPAGTRVSIAQPKLILRTPSQGLLEN